MKRAASNLFILIVAIVGLAALGVRLEAAVKEKLTVHFIDVGQADSILIQTPSKQNILIDGGNDADGEVVIEYLRHHGVKSLNAVIATHPHEDHIGGLDKILYAVKTARVYMPDVPYTTKNFKDFLLAVKNTGAKAVKVKPGLTIDTPGVQCKFLAPAGTSYEDLNDWSAVLHLTYQAVSFLFMGDAEKVSENELLKAGTLPEATVLKVGHHGSASSTGTEFLKRVKPKYSVISVGRDNDYGHPSPVTLKSLQSIKAKIYRTDELGTVVAKSDGKTISFGGN